MGNTEDTLSTQNREAERVYSAYRTFFTSEDGQIVMADLCKSNHIFSTTIGTNSEETHYNEGKRSVILQIQRTAAMTNNELQKVRDNLKSQQERMYEL